MKIIFAVIIGLAAITMVITLVPGIFDNAGANDSTVYATVKEPGAFGRRYRVSGAPPSTDDGL